MRLMLRGVGGVHVTANPQSVSSRVSRHGPSSVGIHAVNFWPGFRLSDPLIRYLLQEAFGEFHQARQEREADLVLTSVFPHIEARYPEKTIAIIWENVRPDYRLYARSFSFDYDDHGGRNQRLPLWYAEIDWAGGSRNGSVTMGGQGRDVAVDIERLMTPREAPGEFPANFCCFVAGKDYAHRAEAVRALSGLAPVDVFGHLGGRPIQSKYDLLPGYRFNLCFENSSAPGYHTEKAPQAWLGGCIPLYWSDASYDRDFNPRSMINRVDFESLEAFVEHVAEVNASPERMAEIYSQPLLSTAPSLAPAIDFLRAAVGR